MGQYKVPQNVEAEDKIIGPLTLKQFIYTLIGVGYGFLSFALFSGLPLIFIVFGVPPTLLFLALGLYQPQDQPFEARFLAMLSYFGKPRKRVWQKEPIAQVFHLEPPKPTYEVASKDIEEVRGQLEKLVQVVDTRGFNSKRAELQEPHATNPINYADRLGAPAGEPAFVEPQAHDVSLADDILDFQHNPSAQNLNELIQNSAQNVRREAVEKMQAPDSARSISVKTPPTSPDILKLAMEGGDLKVSQIASVAQQQILKEGQVVNLRDATQSNTQPS